tara:strand:- start:2533 stop:2736 length:204 start_codon:yes stop_codon:yes gene_type:complete
VLFGIIVDQNLQVVHVEIQSANKGWYMLWKGDIGKEHELIGNGSNIFFLEIKKYFLKRDIWFLNCFI